MTLATGVLDKAALDARQTQASIQQKPIGFIHTNSPTVA